MKKNISHKEVFLIQSNYFKDTLFFSQDLLSATSLFQEKFKDKIHSVEIKDNLAIIGVTTGHYINFYIILRR